MVLVFEEYFQVGSVILISKPIENQSDTFLKSIKAKKIHLACFDTEKL